MFARPARRLCRTRWDRGLAEDGAALKFLGQETDDVGVRRVREFLTSIGRTGAASLRLKLILAVLVMFSVFGAFMTWHSGRLLSAVYAETARSEALQTGRTFAGSLTSGDLRDPRRLERRLASLIARNDNVQAVIVYGRRGGTTVRLASAQQPGLRLGASPRVPWALAASPRFRVMGDNDRHAADVLYPVRDGRARVVAALGVHVDLAGFDRALAHSRREFNTVFLVAALSVSLLLLLSWTVFSPLAALRRAVARVGRGALDERLDWSRRDEIGALARDFDRMVARLGESQQRLEGLALEDPLTGLANHRRLHETLAEELKRAQLESTSLAVIALDLDHFKHINDTYGHPYGDEILRQTGERLSSSVRPGDLVARVGGEEFAIVLPRATLSVAQEVAERARLAVAQLPTRGSAISCSAGIACYPADAWSGPSLLELADRALYAAKRGGRNRTRHASRHDVGRAGEDERAEVASLLERPESLSPVFQPFIALATGEIVGYEALMRFQAGTSQRPTDAWFAQAHRCGLGARLEAAALLAALGRPGRPDGTLLSLNVSPSVLSSAEVQAVLPGDLSGLMLEITEHERPSDDQQPLQRSLAGLRQRGALIAFDDAGAGYAGLQHLMQVRPDVIKLDRALIEGIRDDVAKVALVDSFARFAERTGAALCAEGVEHLDDLRILATLGVAYAQGYAIGRPSHGWIGPSAETIALCREHFSSQVEGGAAVDQTPPNAMPLAYRTGKTSAHVPAGPNARPVSARRR